MKLRDAVALSFSSLRGAAVRTLLTILGLSVGVAAVLTVQTLGEAGEFRVEEEIAHLGVDKVWIRPKNDRYQLVEADGSAIQSATGAPSCASAYTAATVRQGSTMAIAQVAGFDQAMDAVHAPKLLAGRTFHKAEYEQGSPICLIDEILADTLGQDLPGTWLTFQNRRMRIVGVIESLAPHTLSAGGGMVVLPLKTYFDTFGGGVSEITIAVQIGQKTEIVAKHALENFSSEAGYRVDTLEKEIGAAREIVRIFVMVLVCVAAVCMLTGGIGVTNVLLISVRERQNEIGLLKAIGGTNTQLGLLFLLEAVIYAILGDLLGTLLGAALIRLFSSWIGLSAMLNVARVFPVLIATAALGLIAGVAPAVKAARMQPVDALKCE